MVVRVGRCRRQLPRPRRLVGEGADQLRWLLRKTCVADGTTGTSGRGRREVLLLLGRRRPHGHVTVSGELSVRSGAGGDHFCGWRDGEPSVLALPFLSATDASFNLRLYLRQHLISEGGAPLPSKTGRCYRGRPQLLLHDLVTREREFGRRYWHTSGCAPWLGDVLWVCGGVEL